MKPAEIIESLAVLQFTIEEIHKDLTHQLAAVEGMRRQLEKALRQMERLGEWAHLPIADSKE